MSKIHLRRRLQLGKKIVDIPRCGGRSGEERTTNDINKVTCKMCLGIKEENERSKKKK